MIEFIIFKLFNFLFLFRNFKSEINMYYTKYCIIEEAFKMRRSESSPNTLIGMVW